MHYNELDMFSVFTRSTGVSILVIGTLPLVLSGTIAAESAENNQTEEASSELQGHLESSSESSEQNDQSDTENQETGDLSTEEESPAPETTSRPHDGPGILIGGGLGAGYHRFRPTYVDQITGASTLDREANIGSIFGETANIFADFGIVRAGIGTFGINTQATISYPDLFVGIGLTPRFRFEIVRDARLIRSIAPWFGFNLITSWIEKLDSDVYLHAGLALGLDFRIGTDWLYLGMRFDMNYLGLTGPEATDEVDGRVVRGAINYDTIFIHTYFAFRPY